MFFVQKLLILSSVLVLLTLFMDNFVESRVIVAPGFSSGTCTQNADPGFCYANFPSYFYNSETMDCEMFIYGGCGGNDNRFNTRSQCRRLKTYCEARKYIFGSYAPLDSNSIIYFRD